MFWCLTPLIVECGFAAVQPIWVSLPESCSPAFYCALLEVVCLCLFLISWGSWRMQSRLPLAVFSSDCTNCSLSSSHITCSISLISLFVRHCSPPVWQCLSCTGESKLETTIQMQCHRFWPGESNHFLQPVGCDLLNAAPYVIMHNTTHCTSSFIHEGSMIWSLLKVLKLLKW